MLMTCMIFFRGKPALASQWLWLHGPSSMGVSENGYTPQNGNFNKGKDHSPCDFAVPNFQTTPTCRPLVLRTHFIMIASQNAAPIMSIASWKFNAPPRLTGFRASLSELPWFSHSAENNGAILGPEIGHLQYNTKEPSRESSWDILMWAKWFQCFGNITQPGFTCFKNVCWEKKCSNRSIHKGTEHMIRMEESSYPLLPSFGFALPSDLLLLYPVLARVATYSSAICWRNRIDEPVPQMPW